MAYKAHWDSKKEYEKFWSQSPSGSNYPINRNDKPKKKKHGLLWTLLIVVVIFAAVVVGTYLFKGNSVNNTSSPTVVKDAGNIPEFSGADYVLLNNNRPNFVEKDFQEISGENFSNLDRLGRCGTAVAMLDRSMMPTEARGEIGQIKPSGWQQAKYEGYVDSNPPYLYNRCHLIAYALTGQNANELNLITGTRYFNVTAMLPFEEQVMKYLDNSDNHVLYRVTPYFKGNELVARGVEMEAYSVEDQGSGVCYHVFVYNHQPGIEIDYKTGESRVE